MADVNHQSPPVAEPAKTQPESDDPAYLAWKKKKIEAALKHADTHRDDVLTEQQVWQKHGLDY